MLREQFTGERHDALFSPPREGAPPPIFSGNASKFLLIEFRLFATAAAAERSATAAANEIAAQTRLSAIRWFSEIYARVYAN